MEAVPISRKMQVRTGIRQLFAFGYEQAMSCIFAVIVFAVLAVSRYIPVPFIYRYDVILVVLLLVQYLMYRFRLETWDEIKVICLFHIIGLALELYKVHMGSWAYPEQGWTKVFGVPLYSGFMYASVASYLCQAWRRMKLELTGWPPTGLPAILGTAIYLNFFTHHYLPDLRWWLMAGVFLVFLRTTVHFKVRTTSYRMPLILSFFLIGFFIWLAENIATFLGAWQYPDQTETWHIVGLGKITSWYLLIIISVILVAQLKRVKGKQEASGGE